MHIPVIKFLTLNFLNQLSKENDFAFALRLLLFFLKNRYIRLPIKYKGRSVEQGKKIKLKDTFRAFIVLFKHKFR